MCTRNAQVCVWRGVVCVLTLDMLIILSVCSSTRCVCSSAPVGSIACKNFLILAKESSPWGHWQPAMQDGWQERGLALIDWSKSVDTSACASRSTFQYGEEEPWSFNRDAEQICDVVHQLLFGEPLLASLSSTADGQRTVSSTLHR
jgi:hypothetical protein